jgi:polar amino acid transport system ATP-binding protein/sulfate transport system ATP-binding protein
MLQEVANMNELNTIIVISHDIAATVSISDTLWIMGKEKNEQGEFVQGSKILFEIDLLSRGLAWEPEITQKTEFGETIREIRSIFPNLL